MANRVPWTLKAYRLLTALALPFANMILDRRLKRGKELAARLPERRGESSIARPKGPLVWTHAASVGEMLSILPLIDRIRERDITVLVTSGTVTAAVLAEQRLPAGVIHQFAPLDLPQFVARFLDHWRPNLGLFVESDLWPNLIMAGADRGIPLILSTAAYRSAHSSAGGTCRARSQPCSAVSISVWRNPRGCHALCRTRRAALRLTGNLKLDVPAPPAEPTTLWQLQAAIGTRPVIAAASTHPGEEIELVDVHRRLKHSFPGLLTILVPRHPERGAAIAGIAGGAGLTFAQRSLGGLPERDTEIYIADTLGELGLVYRVAPIVFIGGSLVGHGGQNPIEAAKLGAAILHGPHVWNFAEIYSALDAVGGAELVTDSSKLTVRIGAWLTDAEARQQVAQTGLQAMDTLAGALETHRRCARSLSGAVPPGAARGPKG